MNLDQEQLTRPFKDLASTRTDKEGPLCAAVVMAVLRHSAYALDKSLGPRALYLRRLWDFARLTVPSTLALASDYWRMSAIGFSASVESQGAPEISWVLYLGCRAIFKLVRVSG